MLLQKQILIVEDNSLNREMLVEILKEQYSILEAENGQEALDILKRCGDSIALILLDVMMPVMDGFTFLDQMKADENFSLIPVIVTTQSSDEDDEVAALSHGATDFVPKPYRPQVILHRVASIINLRETAAMVNQLQYDLLTGLYSKEFFYQKVREKLQQNSDKKYTIICSNIENFKLYNDTFGVKAGDRLLCEIADSFRNKVGINGICGRFSADRFICLQERTDCTYTEGNSVNTFSFQEKNVIMKWGIYEITDDSISVEQMCDRAMLVVDSIKGRYNRHYAVYDDEFRSKLLREQAITEVMEEALQTGQFVVYLQPKYSLNDDFLAGAEALVRWIHPEWGFMSPGEFIPLFEKNGFITRLDQYVWKQVCALLQDWQKRGYPSLPVSVNMSRADIYQSDLIEFLMGLVKEYEIDPALLHLELTESAYTENPEQIISTVEQLRKIGFVIEMDDFGSGYSSLNMLNQMKIDVLKLDMKFIQNETAKPVDQGILRFIVELARWMNLSVVAEGVETREQLEHLRMIGCDYVQGYFFSKPLPCAEFEKLLEMEISQYTALSKDNWKYGSNMQSVLVVDEDAEYRENIRKTFEGQYRVLEVSNTSDALTCMRDMEQGIVSVVILSMALQKNSAFSFLKTIRQDPLLWRIPVLATICRGENLDESILNLDMDDFLCKSHPFQDLGRRVRRLMGISAFLERERLLQDEACRDYLTGLLNRRGFFNTIDAMRNEDLPLALYLFDLDDLKKINDRYGHDVGDELLCFFGDLLRQNTREGDILCRYGGDEFIVVLRRITPVETIQRKGNEICRGLREWEFSAGFHTTCSCGIALCGLEELPSAELIKRADVALYKAKKGKKGGCCLWKEEEMNEYEV